MSMVKNFSSISFFTVLCIVFLGCGKKVQLNGNAFEQASPAIKADWETAVAADKANDYFTAGTYYSKVMLRESELTPAQVQIAEKTSQAMAQRLSDAVNQGDPAAKEAAVKLMKAQSGRP